MTSPQVIGPPSGIDRLIVDARNCSQGPMALVRQPDVITATNKGAADGRGPSAAPRDQWPGSVTTGSNTVQGRVNALPNGQELDHVEIICAGRCRRRRF